MQDLRINSTLRSTSRRVCIILDQIVTFDPRCSWNHEGIVGAFTDPCAVAMAGFSELAGKEDRDKHTCEPVDEKWVS